MTPATPEDPSGTDTLTVAVPALDEEGRLTGAVEIVVRAAERCFHDYEVLIFNDGSSDGTGAEADALAAANPRVVAIHNETPQNIGGILREALGRARMRYFIWVDGKGATPAEALDQIFALREDAALVVPYTRNQHERPLYRRSISWLFRAVLNLTFRLDLMAYTHLVLCEADAARRVRVRTDSYAFQAELLIKLIKAGHGYVQVGVDDRFDLGKRKSKAFRPQNVWGVFTFFAGTFFDVYLRPGSGRDGTGKVGHG